MTDRNTETKLNRLMATWNRQDLADCPDSEATQEILREAELLIKERERQGKNVKKLMEFFGLIRTTEGEILTLREALIRSQKRKHSRG